ncbi:MAG: SDR family oxidoreductase [Vicinamibacteria bacterium]|nr:SDR family oxidoreductase [Vicinamibacteria bacterium]
MRILVTGGAGFIGSHLAETLVREGHAVRVLDDFSSGKLENLRVVRGDVELIRGDCADERSARRAVRSIEAVFHLGAVPSVARSVRDPVASHRANATATLHMLVASRDAGVRRFIYAGSSSVYGQSRDLPSRETQTPKPLSPYAVDKLAGEHLVRVFSRLYGIEGATLRYFNVFGPRQNPSSPYSGVISLFTTALITGRQPVIYGDGSQSRDFTYVQNVVTANLLALRVKKASGETFNIATGSRTTLNKLLEMIARASGRRAAARYALSRPGDIRHSLADIELARKRLGYTPHVDVKTGLRLTIEWYRARQRRT